MVALSLEARAESCLKLELSGTSAFISHGHDSKVVVQSASKENESIGFVTKLPVLTPL